MSRTKMVDASENEDPALRIDRKLATYALPPLLLLTSLAGCTPNATTPSTATPNLNDTEKYAQNLPEQTRAIVSTVAYSPETKALIDELYTLPKDLQIHQSTLDYLKKVSADKKVADDELSTVKTANEIQKLDISDNAKKNNTIYILSSTESMNAYNSLKSYSENARKAALEWGLSGDVPGWVALNTTLPKDFAEYTLGTKLCVQDRKLTDLERKFLQKPENYLKEMSDYYISEIGTAYPDLAMELGKISFKQMDVKDVEALEDIWLLVKNPPSKDTGGVEWFKPMLDEGIKDKRKYCTPLEALGWILRDRENIFLTTRPWAKYYIIGGMYAANVPEHIRITAYSWGESSISNNNNNNYNPTNAAGQNEYKSDRWKSFDEVTDRLNSPYLVNVWVFDNIKYDATRTENVGEPKTTFELKRGVCRHAAMFAVECLSRSGYNAKDLTVGWVEGGGHSTGLIEQSDGYWLIMDFNYGKITGPYKDHREIADYINKRLGKNTRIILIENNEQLMERAKRQYGVSTP